MSSSSVSIQEVRVFQALRAHAGEGMPLDALAEEAIVAVETAQTCADRFVQEGIAELAAGRYRLRERSTLTDPAPLDRLEHAAALLSGLA